MPSGGGGGGRGGGVGVSPSTRMQSVRVSHELNRLLDGLLLAMQFAGNMIALNRAELLKVTPSASHHVAAPSLSAHE